MSHVRAHRVDLALLAIEGDGVVAAGLDPVVAVEPLAQRCRLTFQAVGEGRVVPDLARQSGGPDARVVGVALDLAGRDRSLSHCAITEEDRIPRVFPALVGETPF